MERKIGFELRQLQQSIKHKIEKERTEDSIELTHGQVRLLMYVYQNDDVVYQKDIEHYLHIRRSTATEILNVLERNGYLCRVRELHDGRLKKIELTEKTLSVIDEMSLKMKNMERMLRQNIDDKDLEVFFYVLDQMKENIG